MTSLVMNGNGGTVSARLVAREAAKTVMSGPASGVTAAATILKQSGLTNAITYDMGGTSTDVALIHGGLPEASSGAHRRLWRCRSMCRWWMCAALGPEAARSPGSTRPACCRSGRNRPARPLTDLLWPRRHAADDHRRAPGSGRLDPMALTGTDGTAAVEPVRAAIERQIAAPLGLAPEEAAAAILTLANARMAGAIRLVSLSRGFDPRDFVLFAFGGAGPLHAVAIARELGFRRCSCRRCRG